MDVFSGESGKISSKNARVYTVVVNLKMAHFFVSENPFLEFCGLYLCSSASHMIYMTLPGFPQEAGHVYFCFHKNMK